MKASIVSRRLRGDAAQEFRRRWAVAKKPNGLREAYLLEHGADSKETLSLTFWEDETAMAAYRASEAGRGRQDSLSELVEHEDWSRVYDVVPIAEARGSGGPRPLVLALPALLAAGGVGSLLAAQAVTRRNQSLLEKGRQAAAEQTRRRNPWLLLPLVLIPAGAGTFALVRKLLGRGSQAEESTPRQTRPAEDRPLQRLETTVATERQESGAAAVPGRPERSHAAASRTAQRASEPASQAAPSTAPREMRVREVMIASPEAVEYDAFVTITEARMRELGVDALPVVADGQLSGIVTRGDLAKAIGEGEPPPQHDRVVDYMSEVPVTIGPDASLEEATRLMTDHHIHHLVVVDGTQPVGVFSGANVRPGSASQAGNGHTSIAEPSRIVVEPAHDRTPERSQ
jgi:CBS domain-containing protein/heme-degrading monooxygenase HmoA